MPATYYESRFLTLGQKLPGHEDKPKSKKPARVYRAGVKPILDDEDEDENLLERQGEPFFDDTTQKEDPVRQFMEARIIEENEEEEEEEEEYEKLPVNLNELDLNNLEAPNVEEEDSSDEEERERDRRRQKALAKAKTLNKKESHKNRSLKLEDGLDRVKIKPLKTRTRPVEKMETYDESEDESDSSSSSDESDSDDEGEAGRPRRPKLEYIPKRKRSEIKRIHENVEESIKKEKKIRERQRKKNTHNEFIKYMRTQDQAKDDNSSDEELPDDDDDIDKDEQFELWKGRELKRMKRVQDMLDKREAEKEDLENRRKMTDREIEMENDRKQKVRPKQQFLHKYFHKGAFYQGDDDVLDPEIMKKMEKNWVAPTGNDKWTDFTDESLPDIRRVKRFGLSSRTKYTHLIDQDTTLQGDAADPIEPVRRNLSGTGSIKKPSKKDGAGTKRPYESGGRYDHRQSRRPQPEASDYGYSNMNEQNNQNQYAQYPPTSQY